MSNSELNHYFPHDSNARSDDKMLSLRSELGNKAYAIYFMILELMREEDNYCLKANGNLAGRLSMELSESKDFMEEFIEKSQEIGLFDLDNDRFYSKEFIRRMAYKDEKSEQARKAALERWHGEGNADEEDEQCGRNADAMPSQKNRNANKKEKENKKEIKKIYNYWREKSETITHRKLSSKIESSINARLDDGYTVDELKDAIDNYNEVVKSEDYFFNYDNWSLDEFLSRGEGKQVEKFLTNSDAYLKDGKKEEKNVDKRPSKSYAPDVEDLIARGMSEKEAKEKRQRWLENNGY